MSKPSLFPHGQSPRRAPWAVAALVAAGLALAQPAQAMPSYTLSAPNGVWGSPNWSESATVSLNGQSRRVGAGLFRLRADDGTNAEFDLLTFCIEVAQSLVLPETFQQTAFAPAMAGTVNALWSNAFGQVANAQTAAAFQLALWDLTHDTDLNLSTGSLQVQANGSTLALAQSWLDNIAGNTWQADPTVLVSRLASPNSQDQLFVERRGTPVGVPATGLLMVGALAGLTLYRCRKSA